MSNKINISRAYFLPLVFIVVFLVGFFVFVHETRAMSCFEAGSYQEAGSGASGCHDVYICGTLNNCQCGGENPPHLCCATMSPPFDYVCINKENGEKVSTATSGVEADVTSVAAPEPKKIIKFIPNITIPGSIKIGGKEIRFVAGQPTEVTGATLGAWISLFYMFFCGIIGILAAANIIFGGFKWLTSFGNASRISAAKERISMAVIGLFLTLGAYVILLTINPRLVQFKDLSIEEIETIEQEFFRPGAELPEDYGKGQSCFYETYGKTKEEVESQLVTVNFKGHEIRVHAKAREAFEKVIQNITKMELNYSFDTIKHFNWREATGATGKMSLHSWGIAIDINGARNPYCPYQWNEYTNLTEEQKTKCKSGELVTDLPQAVINTFLDNCFQWGGRWYTSKDAMHFEWHGNCYEQCPTKPLF